MKNKDENHEQMPEFVDDDLVITLEYTLTVEGKIVETSQEDGAMEILQGYGNIVPGLEEAIYDMRIGETREITVSPADGYGEYDEEAVAEFPKSEFPPEIPLEPGVEIEFEDEEGDLVDGIIESVGKNDVKINFNHPLAGKTLFYKVTVTGIRHATDEELDHGHVHLLEDENTDQEE